MPQTAGLRRMEKIGCGDQETVRLFERYLWREGFKLSLSSGCTCPNRDGRLGRGGCTFCSEGGSGDFAAPPVPLADQIRLAKERVEGKFSSAIKEEDRRYLAYFQSFTNTYGDEERLKGLFHEVLTYPEIVGLSVGTRPDCISPGMLDFLADLNGWKPVWIELGLQTIHESTAESIRRGYPLEVFADSYRRLKAAGLTVIVHVILGLPGESREDMLDTVRYLSRLEPRLDGIKLQMLHILRHTALGSLYSESPWGMMEMEDYAELVVEALRILPEEVVIHRMTGDGPRSLLLAPMWTTDKKRVLNTLNRAIREAER